MEDIICFVISLLCFITAYVIKSCFIKENNIPKKTPSKYLVELGKEYYDYINKYYNEQIHKNSSQYKEQHHKPQKQSYINPCTDNSYNENVIPFFTIVYASQSGTAKTFANALKEEATNNLKLKCQVFNISELKSIKDFNENMLMVFIVSTYGEGGPTDDSVDFNILIKNDDFWSKFKNKNLTYAIFGLGSKSYTMFNHQAKFIDKQFTKRKLIKICETGFGDDSKDIEKDFLKWKKEIFWKNTYNYFLENNKLYETFKSKQIEPKFNNEGIYEIKYESEENENIPSLNIDLYEHSMKRYLNSYNVHIDSIEELRQSNVNGCTLKITFDVGNSGLNYNHGDNFAIYPTNNIQSVNEIASHMKYDLNLKLKYKFLIDDYNNKKLNLPLPNGYTIKDILTNVLDLSCQINRDILNKVKKFITDNSQYQQVLDIIEDQTKMDDFLSHRYNIIDVIKIYPSIQIPFSALINILPHINPRFYTVASSPHSLENKFQIAISLVSWKNYKNETTYGLTSNYFRLMYENKQYDNGVRVNVYPSSFKLPTNINTPMLMICTGTGIAPFISFMQELVYLSNKEGSNTKKEFNNYIILGSRNREHDFIFEKDLTHWKSLGLLKDIYCAFSRDTNNDNEKYVYNILKQKFSSEQLISLVNEQGMVIYSCGSSAMGMKIKQTLEEILGSLNYNKLVSNKQFISEFWENK